MTRARELLGTVLFLSSALVALPPEAGASVAPETAWSKWGWSCVPGSVTISPQTVVPGQSVQLTAQALGPCGPPPSPGAMPPPNRVEVVFTQGRQVSKLLSVQRHSGSFTATVCIPPDAQPGEATVSAQRAGGPTTLTVLRRAATPEPPCTAQVHTPDETPRPAPPLTARPLATSTDVSVEGSHEVQPAVALLLPPALAAVVLLTWLLWRSRRRPT